MQNVKAYPPAPEEGLIIQFTEGAIFILMIFTMGIGGMLFAIPSVIMASRRAWWHFAWKRVFFENNADLMINGKTLRKTVRHIREIFRDQEVELPFIAKVEDPRLSFQTIALSVVFGLRNEPLNLLNELNNFEIACFESYKKFSAKGTPFPAWLNNRLLHKPQSARLATPDEALF